VVFADDSDVESLPQTGMSASPIGLGIASLLSGLGLAFVDKKRKKDK
jgi:LPXTG-motif cell wall-anchored protein